jgi:hypothetical protein
MTATGIDGRVHQLPAINEVSLPDRAQVHAEHRHRPAPPLQHPVQRLQHEAVTAQGSAPAVSRHMSVTGG